MHIFGYWLQFLKKILMDEKEKSKKVDKEQTSFGDEISQFIRHIESLRETTPLVMELVSGKLIREAKAIDNFIKENKIEEKDEKDERKILIPSEKIKEFIKLNDKVNASLIAQNYLPSNFIVAFVSQYDAYLGRLIRTIFLTRPELLNASEKNIVFSELIEFTSIDEARDFVIEQEVESVLRESHLKQFKWVENKLGMKLREDLPSFTPFIEITERRNLFVHCNGVVSRQYISNCKENKVQGIEKVKLGDSLGASPRYLGKCYSVIFEIGVKLGQVIWRKLKPDEMEKADQNLNDICFELLVKGHYSLAINLLSFATTTLKKNHNQEMKCIFIINKALGYYLSGKKEECYKILDEHDWSATSDTFQLGTSVLREEYSRAASLMKIIGENHDRVLKTSYMEWPLFKNFRQTELFKNSYKEIFKEEFAFIETRPQKLTDLLDDIKELRKEADENKLFEETIDSEEKEVS